MADAARRAGVARLIDMVMLVSAPDAPTPRMRENYLSERIFERAGIGAAHVRATIFYENMRALTAATIARDGSILLPWGSERRSCRSSRPRMWPASPPARLSARW